MRLALCPLLVVACTPVPDSAPAAEAPPKAVEPTPTPKSDVVPAPTKTKTKTELDDALAKCRSARLTDLAKFPLPSDAPWLELTPLVASKADIIERLGPPKPDFHGLDIEPDLLVYKAQEPWELLIYLVSADYGMTREFPESLHARLGSMELVPKEEGPQFGAVAIPGSFTRKTVVAADAGWVDFRHGSGVTYSVYGDDSGLGRINRISVGPNDCQRKVLGLPHNAGH